MVENTRPRPSAIALIRSAVLLLCLLAPSAWMMATVPPLWRDADAYNQLTRDPLISTFWGWGAAYGYLAKVPVLLVEQVARLIGSAPPHPTATAAFLAPTDAGIMALLVAQHLALGIAALSFIRRVTQVFWLQILLAAAWASNALFYTFAHCVGSESLSLILIVYLATFGLRLASNRREPGWLDWYLFAITLWLCLLTRQINGLLIFVLPAAFLLAWVQERLFLNPGRSRKESDRGTHSLRSAIIAMAIGMGCVFVAGSLTERLAAKTRFHPHSRVGYTFLWRLQFLDNLTAAQRTALIQKVAERARSDETRRLLSLLSQIHDEGAFSPGSFPPRAAAVLYPTDQIVPWEKVDLALNKMAFAFLVPPGTELRQAAATDFATTAKMPVTAITDHLFEMTAYYFEHRDDMPACAGLVTFRNYNAESITRFPRDFAYFHLWRGLDYRRAVMVWFAALLLLLVVGRWKKANIARVIGFGVALAIIGTLMFAITCLLGEWLPRYALPLWQLLLLSLFLFAGKTGDLVWSRRAVGDVSTRG